MARWWQRLFRTGPTEMPKGLVIRFHDGRVVEHPPLLYRGSDFNGQHEWEACLPSWVTDHDLLKCRVELEYLPARTTLTVTVPDGSLHGIIGDDDR